MGLSQSKPIKFGNSYLRPTFKKYEIIQQYVNKQVPKTCWRIRSNKNQIYEWKLLFSQMTECLVYQLFIYSNNSPQIIKQIQNIKFSKLRNLLLYRNKINNIQALLWLDCQNLKILSIHQNNINRITCLKKLSSKKFLYQLSISENPILQVNVLCRLKFDLEYVQTLRLQYQNTEPIIGEDINFVSKLDTRNLKFLWTRTKNRIIQTKMKIMHKQKYRNMIYAFDF